MPNFHSKISKIKRFLYIYENSLLQYLIFIDFLGTAFNKFCIVKIDVKFVLIPALKKTSHRGNLRHLRAA